MAKRGGKNRGSKKPKKARAVQPAAADPNSVSIEGDLRTVDLHIKAFLDGKVDEAQGAMMAMGRDAAFLVQKTAQGGDNDGLKELARRLAAVPPQVTTNLYALREASVWAHVERAREDAPLASSAEVRVPGGAIALFDPMRVLGDLTRSGRPRRDPERAQAGDIAWMVVPVVTEVPVRFSTRTPDLAPAQRLRLRVSSGVVFVGPPEASDGLRMGTVRIDPFTTSLDQHLARGKFVLVKPGTYGVFALWDAHAGLRVHLFPDPDPKERLEINPVTSVDVRVMVDPTSPI